MLFGIVGVMGDIVLPTTTAKVNSLFEVNTDAGNPGGGAGEGTSGNVYTMLSGPTTMFMKTQANPLTFRSDAPCDTFDGFYIDGVEIPESNYTVSEGSTIITLTADYSNELAVGTHEIKIASNDGFATCELIVNERINIPVGATLPNGCTYTGATWESGHDNWMDDASEYRHPDTDTRQSFTEVPSPAPFDRFETNNYVYVYYGSNDYTYGPISSGGQSVDGNIWYVYRKSGSVSSSEPIYASIGGVVTQIGYGADEGACQFAINGIHAETYGWYDTDLSAWLSQSLQPWVNESNCDSLNLSDDACRAYIDNFLTDIYGCTLSELEAVVGERITTFTNYDTINYQPPVSCTFCGSTINFQNGMTWEEFVADSNYNNDGYFEQYGNYIVYYGAEVVTSDAAGDNPVAATDVIIANHDYGSGSCMGLDIPGL